MPHRYNDEMAAPILSRVLRAGRARHFDRGTDHEAQAANRRSHASRGSHAATFAAALAIAPVAAQQITGVPGSTERDHHDRRQATPATAAEIRRRDQGERQGFQAVVAAARRAAQGRAERAAHHDRRPGLRRVGHLRRRHSDAGDGPHRQGGAALHAVPLHRALLADARGADHRPQPPLGRLRRDRRNVDRLPRLRLHHRPRERHDRHDPAATTAMPPRGSARTTTRRRYPVQRGRAVRPMADRHGLRVLLRLHGRRDRPVDAVPLPRSHARSFRGSASQATTSPPTWRTRPSST